ncbi:MAG: alpha-isopropylmalate synthase regulatory domain-containing protein, partial [Bacteroidales bacterium]
ENYEIINPRSVGINESSIVLTARSGRAALKHRLEKLGFKLDKNHLDHIYEQFLDLADKKKDIIDDDLKLLVGKEVAEDKRKIHLKRLQVVSGLNSVPVATVSLEIDGETLTATTEGNGPIDAAFSAVKLIVKRKAKLEEFLIQAITRGSDDLGKVHVQVENKGVMYYGFSASTDIITASVEAYIDALSQVV